MVLMFVCYIVLYSSTKGLKIFDDFELWANKAPEICCSKCLLKYNEYKQK
jgi:hypothetical protein